MAGYAECYITTRGGLEITLDGRTYSSSLIKIKWKHNNKWHYAEGQHSHSSYLKVKTFWFETPLGEVRVHKDDVKGDCDLLACICPNSYERDSNSAYSSRQPVIMHEVDIERNDQGEIISLVIDSKSYPIAQVSISIRGTIIQTTPYDYKLAEKLKVSKDLEIVTPDRNYSVRFEDLYNDVQRQLLNMVCPGVCL
ncbi:hypothetical protein [Leptolyngbya sp. FACHB-17]|uniref:hypothetical protein n=1 Tax=Leptolyngbya sp. FACHB-17 TaxID=2692803 RepID=UPI001680FF57|nr:hypothetical protein [Leptolyngbya sp. FACHB-17]MBD2079321.1 hypothetical protein [Leptolyngbya sp. FACHB-17]